MLLHYRIVRIVRIVHIVRIDLIQLVMFLHYRIVCIVRIVRIVENAEQVQERDRSICKKLKKIYNDTDSSNQLILKTITFRSFYYINLNLFNVQNVSVASVAKAWSSLRYPSIIISNHCRSIHHSTLWSLCLSFNPLEPRLRLVSLGTKILPVRVSNTIFYNEINFKNANKKNLRIVLFTANSLDVILIQLKKRINCIVVKLKCWYEKSICIKPIIVITWMWLRIILSGDIEINPGPVDVTLMTLNCRGLKKNKNLNN